MKKNRVLSVITSLGLLLGTACALETGEEIEGEIEGSFLVMDGEDETPLDVIVYEGTEVARLTTLDGAELIFSNEALAGEPPSIGVEISSDGGTNRLDAILANDPSALELFLAIDSATTPPAELLEDHQQLALQSDKHSEHPRSFILPAGESDGYFNCENATAWENSFTNWAPSVGGQFIGTDVSGSGRFFGYMGYSPRFYIDVCRPNDEPYAADLYYTGIERRSNSRSKWTRINQRRHALYQPQRRWRYYRYSFGCTSYQYRLHVIHAGGFFHLGARYASEFSCVGQ